MKKEKLKSKKLSHPKQIKEAQLKRLATALLSSAKRTPVPLEDWDMIRRAKILCRECVHFDSLVGGCRLHLMPSMRCERRRRGERLDK